MNSDAYSEFIRLIKKKIDFTMVSDSSAIVILFII